MKLVILGASGRTGKELVKQAIGRGHTVTVVVRDPTKIAAQSGVTIAKADVANADALAGVFSGHDAVLSGLGNNDSKLRLIERSSAAIVQAMLTARISRIVVVLSFSGAAAARLGRFTKLMSKMILGKMVVDQKAGAALLRASGLEWTLAYATVLTNGPLTKRARVVPDTEKLSMGLEISRADVASFMLDALERAAYIREQPVIAGPEPQGK